MKTTNLLPLVVVGAMAFLLAGCFENPNATEEKCSNTCQYAHDGECDDGGPGSSYSLCDCGTDCADCGTREVSDTDCLGGSSSSSSSSGSSSSGSSSSGGSSSSSSSGSSSSSSGSSSSSSSSSGGGSIDADITSATYYFPDINNCWVASQNDNGSRALVTAYYNLGSGSAPISMSNTQVVIKSRFSGESTTYTNTKGLEELYSNNFVFSLCYLFGNNSSVYVEFYLVSGGQTVSDTKNITIARPTGGN